MPRNARCVESELVYHVTQRGVNRQDVFFSHADRTTYLALAEANTADCQVRVFAWCLMSNHVHWVLEAGRANSLAVFFRRVNGRYAQYLNARRRRTGHLWQNRFFSCPVGPTHLWHTLRYVEGNPVRAGLTEANEAYRWSSARAHGKGPAAEIGRVLDWRFWREAGEAEGWRDKLGVIQDVRQVRAIRECTHSGKPYGEATFLDRMEEQFKRRWRPVGRSKEQLPRREMGTERSASFANVANGTGSG